MAFASSAAPVCVIPNLRPKSSLVVLPLLFPLAEFATPPGLLPGGRAIRRKSIDITPHASGVRDYIPGDPMKRIHWPTSIRLEQLMVKEFEQDPQSEVWLFLDTHRGVHFSRQPDHAEQPPIDDLFLLRRKETKLQPSSLEYAVSITASLAHYIIGQRRAVGLVTASFSNYTVIAAERSERQEAKILEELAFLQAESSYTLPGLVTAQMGQLPQGSTAIQVTPMIWTELLMAGRQPAAQEAAPGGDPADGGILWQPHEQRGAVPPRCWSMSASTCRRNRAT